MPEEIHGICRVYLNGRLSWQRTRLEQWHPHCLILAPATLRSMSLDKMRILLVEDAPDIREVFTVLLRVEGADVTATGSGREAADLASRRDFDVVLSDLGLPDMSGDVLIRQILSTARRRTRVIVVTGYGEPYLSRARQAGAEAVFTKPVEWTRILQSLERPGLAATA
ncbi:MAG: response regulator [Candidatus Rokuibacteriota bacterium]|nr:MAG: response regulator [Candidatus Rokubacteria bacterium]